MWKMTGSVSVHKKTRKLYIKRHPTPPQHYLVATEPPHKVNMKMRNASLKPLAILQCIQIPNRKIILAPMAGVDAGKETREVVGGKATSYSTVGKRSGNIGLK